MYNILWYIIRDHKWQRSAKCSLRKIPHRVKVSLMLLLTLPFYLDHADKGFWLLWDSCLLSSEARVIICIYSFKLKQKAVFCKGMPAQHSAMLPRYPQAATERTIAVNT